MLLFLDSLIIFFALVNSIFLVLDTLNFINFQSFFLTYFLILIPTSLIFIKIGLYRAFIRYISLEIIKVIVAGACLSGFFVYIVKINLALFIPLNSIFIYIVILFSTLIILRIILRSLLRIESHKKSKKIAIYGAGVAGKQLLQALLISSEYEVLIIIDDDKNIQGKKLYGKIIYSYEEVEKKINVLNLDLILLAIPSVSFTQRQKIILKINQLSLKVKTIPSYDELINEKIKITELKDIKINDLLGRPRIKPLSQLMKKNIYKKSILVTGAGGSIGGELCRQIISLRPDNLILFDISEFSIYIICLELKELAQKLEVNLITIVGDVKDRSLVAKVLTQNKVNTVYHAAAYKHVPLMEENIMQAINNNTAGTIIMAQEAVKANVDSFTLISTDKAVNPTNIMGASKRLAEKVCQTINLTDTSTLFSIVRFGNVLGSSGSVVPLFKNQIKNGGPITITHPEITRYFMTIEEAVELVIQANSMAEGGEIFVLNMGSPVKIIDLAFKMSHLAGLRPYIMNSENNAGDIAIKIIGLRPGEKMFEELFHDDNNLVNTIHPLILKSTEEEACLLDLNKIKKRLDTIILNDDYQDLRKYLIINADYRPL